MGGRKKHTPRPANTRVRFPAEPYRTVLVCAVIFFDAFGGFAISAFFLNRSLSTVGVGGGGQNATCAGAQ